MRHGSRPAHRWVVFGPHVFFIILNLLPPFENLVILHKSWFLRKSFDPGSFLPGNDPLKVSSSCPLRWGRCSVDHHNALFTHVTCVALKLSLQPSTSLPSHTPEEWPVKMVFLNFLCLSPFPISLDSTLSTLGFLFLFFFFLRKLGMHFWELERNQPLKCQKTADVASWRHLDFPSHMSYWGEAVRGRAAGSSGSSCWDAWLRHWDIQGTIKLSIEYGLLLNGFLNGFYYHVTSKNDSSSAFTLRPLRHNLEVS